MERGGYLPELTIAYHTYGTLNEAKDNVIWICHALTANSNVQEWWPGLVGENCIFNTKKYFVICANILGSCYGTTGPLDINSETAAPYFSNFPAITIRDMVRAHQLLCEHLGIKKIHILAGGSMGGYQALEWSLSEPQKITRLFLIATSARESAWGVAIHTTQRLAIEADCTWMKPVPEAGHQGLKTARAIGMLTYRGYTTYQLAQSDTDPEKLDDFKASSYINYQGEKLVKRFNAYSYWCLTKAMDSHNVSRGRTKTVEEALQLIQQPTLVMGVSSDILCPKEEIQLIADHIPQATCVFIDSNYGHDGFLVETETISRVIHASWGI